MAAIRDGREDMTLGEMLQSASVVSPSTAGHKILQEMIRSQQQLFIIADDEGRTLGLVTLEDVIEEMLGEEIE